MHDRVGLSWRAQFAAEILEHAEEIGALEVVAASAWEDVGAGERRALRWLSQAMPVVLHGVKLGLASSIPVESRRLAELARFAEGLQPHAWSEHLAFVRAGGIEIGHLASPPRTERTVEGTVRNIRRAARALGRVPALENIADVIEPPASTMSAPAWTRAILRASGAALLLDLHNLYANARNFGPSPEAALAAMPLERVEMVHLSGGAWVRGPRGARRLIDDHQHAPPPAVYALLEELARRAPRALTVFIERDGNYPDFEAMRRQMRRARAALARGRASRSLAKAA